MELKELLDVKEELTLYLVAEGLKPATLFDFDPRKKELASLVEKKEERRLWIKHLSYDSKKALLKKNYQLDEKDYLMEVMKLA